MFTILKSTLSCCSWRKNYAYPSKHWTHKLSWSQTLSRVFIHSIPWSIFYNGVEIVNPLSISSKIFHLFQHRHPFEHKKFHSYVHSLELLSLQCRSYVCLAGLPVGCHTLVCAIKGICNQCLFHTSFEFRW